MFRGGSSGYHMTAIRVVELREGMGEISCKTVISWVQPELSISLTPESERQTQALARG